MDYFHSSSNLISCVESSSMVENGKDKKKNGKGGNKGVQKLSTDPQSVAARERRHRISNRFKILQSLVPGGSKMDTVSMLDEAIHYVKYLKAQIWLHQNMIKFSLDDNIDDDLLSSSTVIHPSSSSVASADQEALLTYCQQQQQQPDEFFGAFKPLTPAVPLPNYSYQLGEGTMYFDGYMQ